MSSPRVIIVGAGLMGRWHAYYARRLGARVVGVVDPLAGLPGTTHFVDLDSGLSGVDAEFAHVCTPADTHFELASRCLERGMHVICEKPLTPLREETERLLDLAARKEVRLHVVHQYPCQRGVVRLGEQLPRLGRVLSAEFSASTSGADDFDAEGRARILREILPHPFSVFAALFGDGVLAGTWQTVRDDGDSLEMRALDAEPDLRLVIASKERPVRNHLVVFGTEATACADFYHGFSVVHRSADTRLQKALRPLRMASRIRRAAAFNLLVRAVKRQPAYPGLQECIASAYRGEAASKATIRAIARLVSQS